MTTQSIVTLYCHVASNRIHFLKCILEGYDNLAVISTVDVSRGLVKLRFFPEVKQEIAMLLDALTPEISAAFTQMDCPPAPPSV